MIYICCLDAVDATVYANKVLGVRLREQQSEARIITAPAGVPPQCAGLRIRATPEFWAELTAPTTAAEDASSSWISEPEPRARRNVVFRRATAAQTVRGIASAIVARGGVIRQPYDVPDSLDPESIEEWLARED